MCEVFAISVSKGMTMQVQARAIAGRHTPSPAATRPARRALVDAEPGAFIANLRNRISAIDGLELAPSPGHRGRGQRRAKLLEDRIARVGDARPRARLRVARILMVVIVGPDEVLRAGRERHPAQALV